MTTRLKLTNESNKEFKILRYIMSSLLICAFEMNFRTWPHTPIAHYYENNKSSPYISEFMGWKTRCVATDTILDAHDMIFHFNKNEEKNSCPGANRSDRLHGPVRPVCSWQFLKITLHHSIMHITLTQVHLDSIK
jgi:hypothetical protein